MTSNANSQLPDELITILIDAADVRIERVEWTTPDEPTVWLAVFYGEAKK